jgi:two-component system chemotaxis response regulator CheY
MKCLIVEDDPVSIQVLKGLISRYAIACDIAINGQEGIDLFLRAHADNRPYDLILMDIMMAGINGLQSVLTIREKETLMNISFMQLVKIIMITSLDDPRTVIKALYESDANYYLVKPIRMENLEDALRKLKLTL